MQKTEVYFSDAEQEPRKPILLGTFPAHCVGVTKGNIFKGSVPFNYRFRIAEEAAEMLGRRWVRSSNEEIEEVAEHMPGKVVYSKGIWFNPTPRFDGDNGQYKRWNETMGVKFEETKKNGIRLDIVETDDVLGAPIIVTIGLQLNKQDKNLPASLQRYHPRVINVLDWVDGKPLDPKLLEETPLAGENEILSSSEDDNLEEKKTTF